MVGKTSIKGLNHCPACLEAQKAILVLCFPSCWQSDSFIIHSNLCSSNVYFSFFLNCITFLLNCQLSFSKQCILLYHTLMKLFFPPGFRHRIDQQSNLGKAKKMKDGLIHYLQENLKWTNYIVLNITGNSIAGKGWQSAGREVLFIGR